MSAYKILIRRFPYIFVSVFFINKKNPPHKGSLKNEQMEPWNLCKHMCDVALKVKVFLSLNKQDAAIKTCEVEEL